MVCVLWSVSTCSWGAGGCIIQDKNAIKSLFFLHVTQGCILCCSHLRASDLHRMGRIYPFQIATHQLSLRDICVGRWSVGSLHGQRREKGHEVANRPICSKIPVVLGFLPRGIRNQGLTWGVVQGGEGNVPILCPPQQDPGTGKAMPSKGLVLNQSWAGKAVSIKGHAPNPPPPRHEFWEAKPPALLLRIPQNYTNPSLLRIAQNYTNLSCVIPDHCEGWRAPGGFRSAQGAIRRINMENQVF